MSFLDLFQTQVERIQQDGQVGGKPAKVFNIMGRRASFTGTSVFNSVGEGLGITNQQFYPTLVGGETIEAISASANDTNTAGTGARKIKTTYINTSYNLVTTADINLDGTTAVTICTDMLFHLFTEVTDTGSLRSAAGNITIRINTPATLAIIVAGTNKNLDAAFMIPDGYTGYITQGNWASIQNSQDFRLAATVNSYDRTLSTVFKTETGKNVAANQGYPFDINFAKYPARTRIVALTQSSSTAASTRADVDFTIVLIQD